MALGINSSPEERKQERKTRVEEALQAVIDKISAQPGYTLGDAMSLIEKVRAYGDARASDVGGEIIDAMLDGMRKPKVEGDEWKGA